MWNLAKIIFWTIIVIGGTFMLMTTGIPQQIVNQFPVLETAAASVSERINAVERMIPTPKNLLDCTNEHTQERLRKTINDDRFKFLLSIDEDMSPALKAYVDIFGMFTLLGSKTMEEAEEKFKKNNEKLSVEMNEIVPYRMINDGDSALCRSRVKYFLENKPLGEVPVIIRLNRVPNGVTWEIRPYRE